MSVLTISSLHSSIHTVYIQKSISFFIPNIRNCIIRPQNSEKILSRLYLTTNKFSTNPYSLMKYLINIVKNLVTRYRFQCVKYSKVLMYQSHYLIM